LVELHAKLNSGMSLTFRGGLVRALVWPWRRPKDIVVAILFLALLALHAWERDFGLGFWLLLGLAFGLGCLAQLRINPARLDLAGVPVETARRTLDPENRAAEGP
jgi:hypothetical protein